MATPEELDPEVWEALNLSIGGYIGLVDVVEDVFAPGREDDRRQMQQTAAMSSYAMIVTARDLGEDSEAGALCRDVGESLLLMAGAHDRDALERLPITSFEEASLRARRLGIDTSSWSS